MNKILAIAILSVSAIAGCHGQVPPATTHVVNLTLTPPASCTSGCTYAIFRCSASASVCADTTNTAWSEITSPTTRFSGTAYTDSSASGLTAFYVAETYQGGAHSGPSNTVGPLVVPASPLAPVVNGTAAQMEKPLQSIDPGNPQVAKLELKAVVSPAGQ